MERRALRMGKASLWMISLLLAIGPAKSSAQLQMPVASANPLADEAAEIKTAKALVRQGRTREAESEVRHYLDSGNDGESARALLGLILYQEDQWPASLAEYTRAAKFKTPSASELVVVALDYVMLRDLPKADLWMTEAVQREPQNEAAWRYLGGIKYSENRFAEAIDSYKMSLRLHPDNVLVEDGIGRSWEGLGSDEDATTAYKTALEWQSGVKEKHADPLLHLGALLAREGKTESALPLLTAAEEIAPQDPEVHERLGGIWMQIRQFKNAQLEYEKALALSPANSHLHYQLASVYRKEGMVDQANRELQVYSVLLGSHSSDKLH